MPRHADFARARGIATLLPAYGLWEKCSDLSGSRDLRFFVFDT